MKKDICIYLHDGTFLLCPVAPLQRKFCGDLNQQTVCGNASNTRVVDGAAKVFDGKRSNGSMTTTNILGVLKSKSKKTRN